MGGARMAAWRVHAYGARAELRLDRARVPPLRAPDDVLVRVRAASLNPLDAAMMRGYGARALDVLRAADGAPPALPLVPGRDFAGEVAAAGAGARLRRGQRVWGVVPPHRAGALAQFVLVRERWAGAAPAALSALQAGGALYAALSACAVLRAAGLPAGAPHRARALLLGLGGAGQAALQLLARSGVAVVVGCAGELRALAQTLGAHTVLDRHAPDYERELVECGPYDAVVDCAGLGGAAAGARRWRLARYATLSSPLLRLADAAGPLAGAARAAAALAAQNAAALRAGGGCALRVRWAYFAPRPADVELLRRLADAGEFTVTVEAVFPWWDAPRAFERQAAGSARGKLLLDWSAPRPPTDEPR